MAEGAVAQNKAYSLDDCKEHTTDKDCWLVINDKVYDVTPFLDEHPGGYDIIVTNSGKDATEDYEEIGHSKAANEMLEKYVIGTFKGDPNASSKSIKRAASSKEGTKKSGSSALLLALLPILLVLVAVYLAMGQK